MTSMIGIIDVDKMDAVEPMTPQEQQEYLEYLASLKAYISPDNLKRFMLGVTLTAHACGYNCCIENWAEMED